MSWFEEMTFADLLDRAAIRWPDRQFLKFEEQSITYSELQRRSDDVARALMGLGVQPGDIVALWMPNRLEWVAIQFGVAKAGATLLPINTALRSDDCRFLLSHSGCKVLIVQAESGPVSYTEMINEMMPEVRDASPGRWRSNDVPGLEWVVMLGDTTPIGCLDWDAFLNRGSALEEAAVIDRQSNINPNDRVFVMYTSGTTGEPKGVSHGHYVIRNVIDQGNRLAVRESDVILMYLPLFHAYGLYEGPLLSLVSGATCVLMERFDPSKALALIEKERATLCFGFSTHFQDLLECPDFGERDIGSLRAGILAVGPVSMESLAFRVQELVPGKIVSGYGMTEIGVGATLGFLDEDDVHSATTSGYPLPGYEFKIVDPRTRVPVPGGQPGEVLIRGYQVTDGYLHDPVRTAETIDSDGWLGSGDMGVLLEDGYLRILGRYKDILRVGGENVDPTEVEAAYLAHEAVQSAVVVGVPDDRLDEVVCVCVTLRQGYEMTTGLREELLHLTDRRLASFKRPRHLVALDSVPTTASGKVQRHLVRDIALSQLGRV